MTLTQEQITRLAKLTALQANSEIAIDSVLDSIDAIKNANTSEVSGVSRSGKSVMTPREDVIREDEKLPDELLNCSNQKVAAHQIVLAGIMHGE